MNQGKPIGSNNISKLVFAGIFQGFVLHDCCFRLALATFSTSPCGKCCSTEVKCLIPFLISVWPQLLFIKDGDRVPNKELESPCSTSYQGSCLSLCLFLAVLCCDGKHLDFPDTTESPSCNTQSQCYSRSRLQVVWENAIIICWLLEIFGF